MTVHYITEYASYAVRSRGLDVSFAGPRLVVEVLPHQHEDDWKVVKEFPRGREGHEAAITYADRLEAETS